MESAATAKAIIVGGGIGGLTTAIALQRAGLQTAVFERADELSKIQIGGGLSIWTNAMKALRELDMDQRLREAGTVIDRVEFLTWQGQALGAWDLAALERRFGVPTVGFYRAAMHPILAGAVQEGTLHLGELCTGFEQDASGVRVRFASGHEERGDLLIGADGIHSTTRTQLQGAVKPRYAGYTIWQGVTEVDPGVFPYGVMRILFGPGTRFVAHHVDPVGGNKIFWMGVANAPEGEHDPEDQRKAMLLRRFGRWMKPIATLIESTDMSTTQRFDVHDLVPLTRWGEGRVTLLGDAAHAMTPNMSQGACQSIEDAVVLARLLKGGGDIPAMLRDYERRRIPRSSGIATMAWRLGVPVKWENPIAVWGRNQFMKVFFNSIMRKAHEKDMAFEF